MAPGAWVLFDSRVRAQPMCFPLSRKLRVVRARFQRRASKQRALQGRNLVCLDDRQKAFAARALCVGWTVVKLGTVECVRPFRLKGTFRFYSLYQKRALGDLEGGDAGRFPLS